jgi:hypothetical protein
MRDTEKAAQDAEIAAAVAGAGPVNPALRAAAVAAAADVAAINPPEYTLNVTDTIFTLLLVKFKEFLHNRIGTSLKEGEQNNIIEVDNFTVGELVICLDNRRWGIITKANADQTFNVYTVNEPAGIDNNIVSKLQIMENYPVGELRRSTVIIEQISKPNQKLGDTDLLETYNLNF